MNIFVPMKRVIIFLLVTIPFISNGQNPEARKKIESAKIALISERLGLSPSEAQEFWPIYNEYSSKRRSNKTEFVEARKSYNKETSTEQETQELLALGRSVKERQLSLENEYSEKMLKVIDSKQLVSLQSAEFEFKKMLLKKLDQRRKTNQQSDDQIKRQQTERLKNKQRN